MMHAFSRTELLLGKEGVERLRQASVCVFGIGGVGSYVVEALARSGVGHLTLVDHDRVSITNLNRQLVALHSTLGMQKVEVARQRILDINPEAQVTVHPCYYTGSEVHLQGFDFIAASFVRTAADINYLRKFTQSLGWFDVRIIAKIENAEGVENIDEILDAADGIMVARGDLGVEIPADQVPHIQKKIIHKCNRKCKPVVTATQMLDSMIRNPRPTRAETTDVANAIYDGTTAIMLSGESANGAYPEESVRTMAAIAVRAEADIDYASRMNSRSVVDRGDITTAISHASCTVAEDIKADAIITVTLSGFTARRLAAHKPVCPIIACTTSKETACQMNLLFGVEPVIIRQEPTADLLFEEAINTAKLAGYVKPGDKVVLTAGIPLGVSGKTNMIRVIEVW